jgi:pyruvate/2-oxoglutarate/acetoin dehydrogenase E1 component
MKEELHMKTITVEQAIFDAIREEMHRDKHVVFFGEGVATKTSSKPYDFAKEFGKERVRNTPLSEGIIAGTAVGAAATGLRPIIDMLFLPFVCYAMEEIVNSAATLRYVSGGQFSFPFVLLARTGCGWTSGAQHNRNLEALFCHIPGLKVVMPSTPYDFKGLLKASIRDDNPVIFIIDLALLYTTGDVPDEEYLVPLGKASVVRSGKDLTIATWAKTVFNSLKAAEALAKDGIQTEVIDLRTLKPLDEEAVLNSVKKTGRIIIVHEASKTGGYGAEIAALVAEKAFHHLKAPIQRLAGPDAPPPSSYPLEMLYVPQSDQIYHMAKSFFSEPANV